MAPTVHREGPWRFFFYANDHLPPHVHVEGNNGSAKILLDPDCTVIPKYTFGLNAAQVERARRIVSANRKDFLEDWNAYFKTHR